jgi:superfamily II DNA/RNA helicase
MCPYVPFTYGNIEEPAFISPASVYIVDEADECLNYLVSFDKSTFKLNGLSNLRLATRIIFFSATLS